MNKNYLFIKGVKRVDYSVFCVDDDQKDYYDAEFNCMCPYSSGQQIKRSIIESGLNYLGVGKSPVTLKYEIDGKKVKQKEISQVCDPSGMDQLIGGWMTIDANGSENARNLKRRSPLSISAMTLLHPMLGGVVKENKMTFDRSNEYNDNIIVRKKIDKDKYVNLSEKEISEFLNENNLSLNKINLIDKKNRVNGLFQFNVAIDLENLFRVSFDEISLDTLVKLKNNDWVEVTINNKNYIQLPEKYYESYAEAIANGIINWRITSNQSRTFDNMPLLVVAISDNANYISNSIYCDYNVDENGKNKYFPVVNSEISENTKVFIAPVASGYINDVKTSINAYDDAKNYIKGIILSNYSK